MINYLGVVIIGLVIMAAGELLPNETKRKYKEEGHSWSRVLFYSNLSAIIAGSVSIVSISNMSNDFNPILIPFAITILTYITAQSFLTDMKIFLINRNILRVAYATMYIISLYNVLTNDSFRVHQFSLFIFTITLIFIFIFIPIGPSDVRMIAAALPYSISIGGYPAIVIFSAVLFAISIYMIVERTLILIPRIKTIKENDMELFNEIGALQFYINALNITTQDFNNRKEGKKAVGPYMTLPFVVYLLIYPVFL